MLVGSVLKNLPADGHGLDLWSGKTPHAAGQQGLWATSTEPACLEPVLDKRRHRREMSEHCDWRVAPALRN